MNQGFKYEELNISLFNTIDNDILSEDYIYKIDKLNTLSLKNKLLILITYF